MAIRRNKGFALLIAVIFMAVALSLGLSLASLAYKQEVLASAALESQSAFYAADAGLECALRADQQENAFAYGNYVPSAPDFTETCGGDGHLVSTLCYNSAADGCSNQWVMSWQVPLAFPDPVNQPEGTEKACAIVTIYKPAAGGTTYLFSQGYDISCANIATPGIRFASRGLSASYSD